MVNTNKMSKSKIAMIALALLLVLSVILTATGAWFTDSATPGGEQLITFGHVGIGLEDNEIEINASQAVDLEKFLPGDSLTIGSLTVYNGAIDVDEGAETERVDIYVAYMYQYFIVAQIQTGTDPSSGDPTYEYKNFRNLYTDYDCLNKALSVRKNSQGNVSVSEDVLSGAYKLGTTQPTPGLNDQPGTPGNDRFTLDGLVLSLSTNAGNVLYGNEDDSKQCYVLNKGRDYAAWLEENEDNFSEIYDLTDAQLIVAVECELKAIQVKNFCDYDWAHASQTTVQGQELISETNPSYRLNSGVERFLRWASFITGQDEYHNDIYVWCVCDPTRIPSADTANIAPLTGGYGYIHLEEAGGGGR